MLISFLFLENRLSVCLQSTFSRLSLRHSDGWLLKHAVRSDAAVEAGGGEVGLHNGQAVDTHAAGYSPCTLAPDEPIDTELR